MLAYTYVEKGKFALREKAVPRLQDPQDALVRVTLASICTSDLHILHGSVPRAVPGVTVGHEMVGVVEAVGPQVTAVRPGDRVAVNVETFCGALLLLRARLCQQLHGPERRLGPRLPDRRRPSGVRPRAVREPGPDPHPGGRLRPQGPARRGRARHGILGRAHRGDPVRETRS